MIGQNVSKREEAINWAVAAQDPHFDDWEGLEDWLAADASHADLYDRATIAADEAREALANDDASSGPVLAASIRRVPRWAPLAIAASLAAIIGSGGWLYLDHRQPETRAIATVAGERRTVTLGRTVRLDLGGETTVRIDGKRPRAATLEGGEALFTVAHDVDHPFVVTAGNVTVTDVGTIFNIDRQADATIVAVAEGSVRVSTHSGTADVSAGQAVTVDGAAGALKRNVLNPATVGAWRSGRLDFANMTIAELAARIHRATGTDIAVAPDIAARRVAGSIQLGGDIATTFQALAPILDISIARRGDGWAWSLRGADPS